MIEYIKRKHNESQERHQKVLMMRTISSISTPRGREEAHAMAEAVGLI